MWVDTSKNIVKFIVNRKEFLIKKIIKFTFFLFLKHLTANPYKICNFSAK